jgi:ubiquinone/menaquinone biosynthesis C-methylase UbiE
MTATEAAILLPPTWHTLARFLYFTLLAVVTFYIVNQVRKPNAGVGRFFLWIMNLSHSSLTDWGLAHVDIETDFTILDVGCGGGRTIEKLAALAPTGKVYGLDYANGSVAASRRKNAKLIGAGRVEITLATVSQLPFPNDAFDLVTAVETQYYWPDLVNDMREILRVLKPGGTLVVILESYKRKGLFPDVQLSMMKLLRSTTLSVEQQSDLFRAAGYTGIQIHEESRKGWMCGIGSKPLNPKAPTTPA